MESELPARGTASTLRGKPIDSEVGLRDFGGQKNDGIHSTIANAGLPRNAAAVSALRRGPDLPGLGEDARPLQPLRPAIPE